MSIEFLSDEKWDFPFFKKLAANDTGSSPGHQAGMVIPKELRIFFPSLTGHPTAITQGLSEGAEAIFHGKGVVKQANRLQRGKLG